MEDEPEVLTPYQQSLVDECSTRSWPHRLRRWGSIVAVIMLCTGFVARFYDVIPAAADGWLIFVAAGYILLNWAGAFMGGSMTLMLFFLKTVMEKYKDSPWDQELEKLRGHTRSVVVTFAKHSKLLGSLQLNASTIMDMVADWSLFIVLVTVNHPYMAILHGFPLILQYKAIGSAKKSLYSLIASLPDPLEETTKTNIDDLMDKLCDPDEGKK